MLSSDRQLCNGRMGSIVLVAKTLLILLSILRSLADENNYGNNYYDYTANGYVYNGINVCDHSVVQVLSLYFQCDSPYTFYYGNGANRASPVCDYGDKITMTCTLYVVDDIQETDEIFVTMAVYDTQGGLLASTAPDYLCQNLVGYACTYEGTYTFTTKLKLSYFGSGDLSKFSPLIQMAFSTEADSGYNLGAVNTVCEEWDADQPSVVQWTTSTKPQSPVLAFLSDFGILIGTGVLFLIFAAFVGYQARDRLPCTHLDSGSRGMSLMD